MQVKLEAGFKPLMRENPVTAPAFCRVHVRQDRLDAAKSRSGLQSWMFSWVESIGELDHFSAWNTGIGTLGSGTGSRWLNAHLYGVRSGIESGDATNG